MGSSKRKSDDSQNSVRSPSQTNDSQENSDLTDLCHRRIKRLCLNDSQHSDASIDDSQCKQVVLYNRKTNDEESIDVGIDFSKLDSSCVLQPSRFIPLPECNSVVLYRPLKIVAVDDECSRAEMDKMDLC